MKLQFPVSVRLLAVGCLLSGLFGFATIFADRTGVVREQSLDSTSRQQPNAGTGQNRSKRLRTRGNGGGRRLLRQSAANLSRSGPIQATARMSVNLFGDQIVANGRYCQQGNEKGLARLEFTFGDAADPLTIQQICDGTFYYRLESIDKQPLLEYINLTRVAESDEQSLIADKTTWETTGGLSSLLNNLASYFEFDTVVETSQGDTPILVLKGRWDEDRLRRLLFGQVNSALIRKQIQWDKIAHHLPRSVEIVLGNDSFFPLFPYRISFQQERETDEGRQVVNIVVLELYELTRDVILPDELFKGYDGESSPAIPSDFTAGVVERLRNLNQAVRAADASLQPTRNR